MSKTVKGISVLDKNIVKSICSFLELIELFFEGLNLTKERWGRGGLRRM